MNCPLHPLRPFILRNGGLWECPVCQMQFGPLESFFEFGSFLSPETRPAALCFTHQKKCPQCQLLLTPFRIANLEAWLEQCTSCQQFLVTRTALQSALEYAKKRQREEAWKSFSPQERQEMALGLSEPEERVSLEAPVSPSDALKALVGVPVISKVKGERLSLVTLALLFINSAVFGLGLIDPARWSAEHFQYSLEQGWHLNLVRSLFAHASVAHLLGNLLFLFPYGDAVERVMRHERFALAYVGLGAAAMWVQCWLYPSLPVLGASGAIAGLMGLTAVLQQQAKLKVFLFSAFALDVPIWFGLAFYFLLQFLLLQAGVSGIAFAAHLAGFFGGVLVGLVVRLFSSDTF
jgi:membrane associated rhomboid family serine protease